MPAPTLRFEDEPTEHHVGRVLAASRSVGGHRPPVTGVAGGRPLPWNPLLGGITHGEPHRGNVFRTTQGWAIVDWDTALVAPPERDLWDLPAFGDPATEGLYRLRWDLSEIAIYVAGFRAAHGNDRNDQKAWTGLVNYLDIANRWPNLA